MSRRCAGAAKTKGGGRAAGQSLGYALERLGQAVEARGVTEPDPPAQGELVPAYTERPASNVAAVLPRVSKEARADLKLAAIAVAAGDPRLSRTTVAVFATIAWPYRPGRALRFSIRDLAHLSNLPRSTVQDAILNAETTGHLWRDRFPSGRRRGGFWLPAVELAARTGWQLPEQFELPLAESLAESAANYLHDALSGRPDKESGRPDKESGRPDSQRARAS